MVKLLVKVLSFLVDKWALQWAPKLEQQMDAHLVLELTCLTCMLVQQSEKPSGQKLVPLLAMELVGLAQMLGIGLDLPLAPWLVWKSEPV